MLINAKYNKLHIENEVINAILSGYFQNKEILCFMNKNEFIKSSSVEYTVKKLLKRFNVSNRTALFRKLLNNKNDLFNFYNTNLNKQLL